MKFISLNWQGIWEKPSRTWMYLNSWEYKSVENLYLDISLFHPSPWSFAVYYYSKEVIPSLVVAIKQCLRAADIKACDRQTLVRIKPVHRFSSYKFSRHNVVPMPPVRHRTGCLWVLQFIGTFQSAQPRQRLMEPNYTADHLYEIVKPILSLNIRIAHAYLGVNNTTNLIQVSYIHNTSRFYDSYCRGNHGSGRGSYSRTNLALGLSAVLTQTTWNQK